MIVFQMKFNYTNYLTDDLTWWLFQIERMRENAGCRGQGVEETWESPAVNCQKITLDNNEMENENIGFPIQNNVILC